MYAFRLKPTKRNKDNPGADNAQKVNNPYRPVLREPTSTRLVRLRIGGSNLRFQSHVILELVIRLILGAHRRVYNLLEDSVCGAASMSIKPL